MQQFLTALMFGLKEQLANRFAFGLLVVFVPIWYWILGVITPSTLVPFKFGPTGSFVQANGHDMILLAAGLNVLALILGFMFFHSAHHSLEFDTRLTRAGLGRIRFMLAKITALLIVTASVALYAILMLVVFWHFPHDIFEVWLSFWLVSLVYGSFGMLLGVLLNSELAGFFIIIMLSMIDVFIQAPVDNPAANKAFLAYFPSYSAMQLGVAGGFTHLFVAKELVLGLLWVGSFLLIALGIFYVRTRRKSSVRLLPEY